MQLGSSDLSRSYGAQLHRDQSPCAGGCSRSQPVMTEDQPPISYSCFAWSDVCLAAVTIDSRNLSINIFRCFTLRSLHEHIGFLMCFLKLQDNINGRIQLVSLYYIHF